MELSATLRAVDKDLTDAAKKLAAKTNIQTAIIGNLKNIYAKWERLGHVLLSF